MCSLDKLGNTVFVLGCSKRTEGTAGTATCSQTRSTAHPELGIIQLSSTTLCAVSFKLLPRPWTTVSPTTYPANSSSKYRLRIYYIVLYVCVSLFKRFLVRCLRIVVVLTYVSSLRTLIMDPCRSMRYAGRSVDCFVFGIID